jgi:Probable taurine catabolism dioxygenase
MGLSIRRLGQSFAAEVRGVDLRQPFEASVIEAVYDAFLEHGVLVLPGQAIDIDRHLAFAATFGELWQLPDWNMASRVPNRLIDDVSNVDAEGRQVEENSPKLLAQLANRLWHSDLSSNPVAAKASMLHALEIALEDGETEFADPRGGYEALPQAMKDRLDGMVGEFSWAHSRMLGGQPGVDVEKLRQLKPPSYHPVVRTHPETGRKNLFIGANLERIVGLGEEESHALIRELTEFTTQDRFVYRHRWAVHDLVIWDNRCTLHRAATYDAKRYRRVMHRATVLDDGPTTADGNIIVPEVRKTGPRLAA